MENQVRWNCIPNERERKQEWYVVLINTSNKELNRLYSRTLKQLASIEEITERNGNIDGLHYRILRILTEKTQEQADLNQVFKGKKVEDRELYERQKTGIDGLEAYVQRALKKDSF